MAKPERTWTSITNPLTVIGVFAGVSEVSGTVALPLLGPDIQHVFVWFVMIFPLLLVLVFFLTLNFNPRCLYAPSDYRDEGLFSEMMTGLPRTTAKEIQNPEHAPGETAALGTTVPAPISGGQENE
ncbi:MAG: hypothetical protein A2133_05110 [Actinobacteria bacterium RBG_16_64_13]|nr:MAG: hypothetical protein A2133_05110 [Actinobacteria bacterium RBG_16_64_13]